MKSVPSFFIVRLQAHEQHMQCSDTNLFNILSSQTVHPGSDKSLETVHSTSKSAVKLPRKQSRASAVTLAVANPIISMYFLGLLRSEHC
jgi:hypothetical protein